MEKLINILNLKLSLDRVMLESELESVINGNLPSSEKVEVIDGILSKLALNDIKLNKWVMLTKGNSDVKNNLEENKEE